MLLTHRLSKNCYRKSDSSPRVLRLPASLLVSHSTFRQTPSSVHRFFLTYSQSMEALRSLSTKLATTHREKVVHALLLGSMVAIGFRSEEQQKEIESLEAEKATLRASNTAASTAMWSWREELFRLAESDSQIISASRVRAIYGEEEPTPATSSPSIDATGTSGNITTGPVLVS